MYAKGAGSIPVRVPIFSDYVSRSLRPWSLKWLLLALFLPSERAPGVLIVRRRESGRGLGPSLPYVITARLALALTCGASTGYTMT